MISIIEDENKNSRLDKVASIWDHIPDIGDELKTETSEFRRTCACLLNNQTNVLSKLSDSEINEFLKVYNFESPEDCLRKVIDFCRKFSRIDNWKLVPLETSKDTISYYNDSKEERAYLCNPCVMSTDEFTNVIDKANFGLIMVLVPFATSVKDPKACYDWIILKLNKNN